MKYLFIYHNPPEAYAEAGDDLSGDSDVMTQWMTWADTVGKRMVDFGSPAGGGQRVSPDGGVSASTREVTGYTILEADSMDDALALAKAHPHLRMPGGCEIEVHELSEVPS